MEQTRRWAPALGFVVLALLWGVGGLPAEDRRLAADALAAVAALGAAAVLLTTGRRRPADRGWRLLAGALLLGVAVSAVIELVSSSDSPVDPARTAASVPAHLVAAAGVLSLLGRSRLRAGGARLFTESALFCTAAFVLTQVLVVGPLVRQGALSTASRAALEISSLAATVLVGAGLTLLTASWGARRAMGAVTLAGLSAVAIADCLAVLGSTGPLLLTGLAARAVLVVGLVLLVLAAATDPGAPRPTAPRCPRQARRATPTGCGTGSPTPWPWPVTCCRTWS